MKETELRDHVAADIGILEKGLVLQDKEKYIPNELGTKGFIDLYAHDADGHHVLIELKRSDAASREAIHEIYKYVEGVKRHLGVRDDEIRVIVASTEWRELLVPFSRFAADSELSVIGLQLEVSGSPTKISASPVRLLAINQGRFLAPWHEVNWYLTKKSLDKGIKSIEKSCKDKGIENYVVVVLQPGESIHSEHEAAMWNALSQLGMEANPKNPLPQLPNYEFIAYFAMQLSHEECIRILARDSEQLDEARETIADMGSEESLLYLHELVQAMHPTPNRDHLEIGNPAKLSKFLDSRGCSVVSIIRHGVFKRNALLSDDSILSELRGEDGATGQRFKRTVSVSNRAKMSATRSDIRDCLDQNPVWQGHLMRALDEIEVEHPQAEIEISIFNPATGIFTLYLTTSRGDGILYLPSYHVLVNDPKPVRMYFGVLESSNQPLGFRELLDKYYGGDIFGLMTTMSWGGWESRDLEIIEDMGLAYRSYKCEIVDDVGRSFFKLNDGSWQPNQKVDPFALFEEYVRKNEKLVGLIVHKLSERLNGGLWDGSSSSMILDDVADVARGRALGKYFLGAPNNCDVCDCPLLDYKYMADAQLAGSGGPWGFMCEDCFVFGGGSLGPGKGQLYLNDGNRWLLVGGFVSDDL